MRAINLDHDHSTARTTSTQAVRVVRALAAAGLLLLLSGGVLGQENDAANFARRVPVDATAAQQAPVDAHANDQPTPPPVTNPFGGSATSSVRPPTELARAARVVFVRSQTLHVPAATFENELRKRQDFQALGLIITRDPTEADLWIELDRNIFTRTFVLTAVDPKSNTLVISTRKKAYLLIGDRVASKLAKSFIRQMREMRGAHT